MLCLYCLYRAFLSNLHSSNVNLIHYKIFIRIGINGIAKGGNGSDIITGLGDLTIFGSLGDDNIFNDYGGTEYGGDGDDNIGGSE